MPERTSTTTILRTPTGDFTFDGGAVVVNFAHSGGSGPGKAFESLHHPRDLVRWLADSPLGLPRSMAADEADLEAADAARGAFYSLLSTTAHGRPPARGVVTLVNRLASVAPLVPRLSAGGDDRRWHGPVTVDQALSTLSRELIEIVSGPLASRVSECAAGDCGVVFVDTSRSGARRWCAMERCGNRAKVRAFRGRERT